jgi:hypothetical protein
LVKYENYERLPNGQCSGRPSKKASRVFTIFGKDFQEVENKIEKLMEILDNETRNNTG